MKCVIEADDLKKIVKGTKRFVTSNSYNELMNWIHITVNAETKEVMAEALDGHRISREYCRAVECDESFKFYIKPRIPKVRNEPYATFEIVGDKVLVTVGDNIIGYRQPAGDFFDTMQLFKDASKNKAEYATCVDCKLLAEALMSVSCPGSTRNLAKIEIRNKVDPIIIVPIGKDNKDIKLVCPVKTSEV